MGTAGGRTHGCHQWDRLTPMVKTQVYFESEDLKALHRLARRSKRSVAELIREAVRATWLAPHEDAGLPGPIALWMGEVRVPGSDHDSIYDEP